MREINVLLHANNKGTDNSSHQHNLVRTIVIVSFAAYVEI